MPELPEVEIVCRGLRKITQANPTIVSVEVSSLKLRNPYPAGFTKQLAGLTIKAISRRAKYIVFDLGSHVLLSHLGMTGSWRMESKLAIVDKHDHLRIKLNDGRELVYRDPRRFGYVDLVLNQNLNQHRFFGHLGPEPLDSENFNVPYLLEALKNKKVAIKTAIMDQQVVVGVGNIYANEALYRAHLRPTRKACSIKEGELSTLIEVICEVLNEAIKAGGSTISDYRQADGEKGSFQTKFLVYGREKENCVKCRAKLKSAHLNGRATVWCPKCQR
jgi:formamidopyrimidine-DNA glycosylase